jgi:hypothetical protein
MRVFWLNGGLMIEPETPVEAEAMLLLARNIRYDLPNGYDEDGRGTPAGDSSIGECDAGTDLQF